MLEGAVNDRIHHRNGRLEIISEHREEGRRQGQVPGAHADEVVADLLHGPYVIKLRARFQTHGQRLTRRNLIARTHSEHGAGGSVLGRPEGGDEAPDSPYGLRLGRQIPRIQQGRGPTGVVQQGEG